MSTRPGRFETRLVSTGQHYDPAMSQVFFDELGLPKPDFDLAVGSASHAQQTAEIMRRFESVLQAEQPHVVVVVGDVNSTLACALASSKFSCTERFTFKRKARRRPVVIHLEAGLRSFDDDMPEEINRRLTDSISELLFVSEPSGEANLRREGVAPDRYYLVGNVMIDTLIAMKERAGRSNVLARFKLEPRRYVVLTLHRPSNVDDERELGALLDTLDGIAAEFPIVFPVHPRTQTRLDAANLRPTSHRWLLVPPLGYTDFVRLESCARLVMTDSGGIQEETTVLGVPCLTLRENTERPITVSEGTNLLAGTTRESIRAAYAALLRESPAGKVPQFWDGKAAERIVHILEPLFG